MFHIANEDFSRSLDDLLLRFASCILTVGSREPGLSLEDLSEASDVVVEAVEELHTTWEVSGT